MEKINRKESPEQASWVLFIRALRMEIHEGYFILNDQNYEVKSSFTENSELEMTTQYNFCTDYVKAFET